MKNESDHGRKKDPNLFKVYSIGILSLSLAAGIVESKINRQKSDVVRQDIFGCSDLLLYLILDGLKFALLAQPGAVSGIAAGIIGLGGTLDIYLKTRKQI